MSLCCAGCFHDSAIIQYIGLEHSNNRCGHCKSENAFTIAPEKLSRFFEPFLGLVTENESGNYLADILQDNFYIFNSDVVDYRKLFGEILGFEFNEVKYCMLKEHKDYLNNWEQLKQEIKYKNRFFPEHSIYSSLFDIREDSADADFFQIIEQLKVNYNVGECFYRTRINDELLDNTKMGKPPQDKATAGRANPEGISYLYVSDNMNTSVAEVRPNYTSVIQISELTLISDISLIDLTSPRKKSSICFFDEGRFNNVIGILKLLESLSQELSKPVKPESSGVDYIPTQFLCEFLKSFSKCDGIIFESSFGTGKNIVLYDDNKVNIKNPIVNKLTRVLHEFEPVQG